MLHYGSIFGAATVDTEYNPKENDPIAHGKGLTACVEAAESGGGAHDASEEVAAPCTRIGWLYCGDGGYPCVASCRQSDFALAGRWMRD
jgi:hypothetical protein